MKLRALHVFPAQKGGLPEDPKDRLRPFPAAQISEHFLIPLELRRIAVHEVIRQDLAHRALFVGFDMIRLILYDRLYSRPAG